MLKESEKYDFRADGVVYIKFNPKQSNVSGVKSCKR
jgi:hypothetical protein